MSSATAPAVSAATPAPAAPVTPAATPAPAEAAPSTSLIEIPSGPPAADVKPAEGTPKPTEQPAQAPAEKPSEAASGLIDGFGTEASKTPEPAAADKPSADTPAPVEIKLPEGMTAPDPKVLEDFQKFAGEIGLSSEQATKIATREIERANKAQTSHYQEIVKAAQTQNQKWESELRNSTEFAGEDGKKFEEAQLIARKGFRKFGGEELANVLIEIGGGMEAWKRGEAYNLTKHPAFFRLFHELGKAMGEDTVTDKPTGGTGEPTQEQRYKQIYNHPTSEDARRRRGFS